MNAALAKIEQPQESGQVVDTPTTMMALIARAASDPSVDLDKMDRLMAMKERLDAKQAENDFNAAMTHAQQAMRPVSADATNPQTRSKYATYAKLDSALRPIYGNAGFSISFNTSDGAADGAVRVLAYVSHSGGHTRTYQADMPNDGKGAKGNDVMTRTHAQGSAMSYGMRYLLKMIFNVAVGEDDNDGNGAGQNSEERDQAQVIIGEWLQVIADCPDTATLQARKKECVKAYGMADLVPKALQAKFTSRAKELQP